MDEEAEVGKEGNVPKVGEVLGRTPGIGSGSSEGEEMSSR